MVIPVIHCMEESLKTYRRKDWYGSGKVFASNLLKTLTSKLPNRNLIWLPCLSPPEKQVQVWTHCELINAEYRHQGDWINWSCNISRPMPTDGKGLGRKWSTVADKHLLTYIFLILSLFCPKLSRFFVTSRLWKVNKKYRSYIQL